MMKLSLIESLGKSEEYHGAAHTPIEICGGGLDHSDSVQSLSLHSTPMVSSYLVTIQLPILHPDFIA